MYGAKARNTSPSLQYYSVGVEAGQRTNWAFAQCFREEFCDDFGPQRPAQKAQGHASESAA
jgi:hypothetical protein